MTFISRLAAALGFAAAPPTAAERVNWPELPKSRFIVGRPATLEDAKAGNAIFSTNGTGAGAVMLAIPQYVLWSDEQGAKHPMILVQAEKTPDGQTIVGLRDFSGQESVATLPEVELLGTKKPN
ncbi:hypothetical protein [Sphingomonas changbaiensis]|uniref:hypothetical protein n=1 Tax=Sphingomonas changbaiensis TaxID=529705 RepID=UPI0012EED030|nr:hypothetical protein [Sphingomonas changbaiensis]